MQLFSLLSIAIYCVIGTWLAVRLLGLWLRTRELPELLLGTCLGLIASIGYPFAVVSSALGSTSPRFTVVAFVGSILAVSIGSFAIYLFVWKVFRPDSRWARAAVAVAAVGFAVVATGNIIATLGAGPQASPDMAPFNESFKRWTTGFFFFSNAGFAWSAIESLMYWSKLRKRLALGLTDPVLVHRFFFWGMMGASVTTISMVNLTYMHMGYNFVSHPVPLMVAATLGIVNSVFVYLAFLPPKAYLEWARRGAQG